MNYENLKNSEFVIFDVETTGLSPQSGDRVIEIAALKVRDLKPVEEFYTLVDPDREISWGAFLVNRISQEMLMGAPKAHHVFPDFLKFIDGTHLIGHNIRFDLEFLSHELARLNLNLNEDTKFVDTIRLAKKVVPDLVSYKLWFLARTLGINVRQTHRAMADVELTFHVFLKLLERLPQGHSDFTKAVT